SISVRRPRGVPSEKAVLKTHFVNVLSRASQLRTWVRFPSPAPVTLFPSNNLPICSAAKARIEFQQRHNSFQNFQNTFRFKAPFSKAGLSVAALRTKRRLH